MYISFTNILLYGSPSWMLCKDFISFFINFAWNPVVWVTILDTMQDSFISFISYITWLLNITKFSSHLKLIGSIRWVILIFIHLIISSTSQSILLYGSPSWMPSKGFISHIISSQTSKYWTLQENNGLRNGG